MAWLVIDPVGIKKKFSNLDDVEFNKFYRDQMLSLDEKVTKLQAMVKPLLAMNECWSKSK
eukprot:4568878-Amphidinium_carterae.1